MNSRIENGQMTLPTKQSVINEVKEWVREEDAEMDDASKAFFFDGVEEAKPEGGDRYISYWANDGCFEYERKIYFPEADSIERIKASLIYDEKVKEYIDPEAVAAFIFNCIDVNALGGVQHIALLWDEPILDEDSENEDWKETKGRQELMDKASDGCDEYAMEVGLEALGINWVERSAVIINIGNIVEASKESAEMFAEDYYFDVNEWQQEFPREFKIALVSTICHEFRHAVYGINEFTPKDGSDERYPALGGTEEEVEKYGNHEAEQLLQDPKAKLFIEEMCMPTIEKIKEEKEQNIRYNEVIREEKG